eukprot:TRINITY_DN1291_c0_g1_i1.p1 TRINITY_DN1291_c0_g1~~TRINITY_DN1291_c0_g1_i1.p1  ORF type:complete len:396 (+),score=104.95 TRINITY_DN1291_c0_g1_i1:111-1298(+)
MVTCTAGLMDSRLFPLVLAKRFGAKVISLEHRFFGKTQPFEDLSTEGLKFLNTKQALADLAYFIQTYQDQINADNGITEPHQNQWIALGGSYPGALSAWLRIKYPHLVVGSLSSSGVVNAILNFTAFDEQVARATGHECASALREATAQIEANLPKSKSWFQAQNLSDHDFLYLIADSGAEAVQYGHRLELCNQMVAAATDPDVDSTSIGKQFANFTVNFFYPVLGNSPADYDSTVMADPNVDPLAGGRQWWWMKCTEVAYFQVAPKIFSIRSHRITLEWHREMCNSIFGMNFGKDLPWPPHVDETNVFYGGINVGGSNIFFSNGVEDPWQWAGVRAWVPKGSHILHPAQGVHAEIADCEQCAHCQDLHTPSSTDPESLRKVREHEIVSIQDWLK